LIGLKEVTLASIHVGEKVEGKWKHIKVEEGRGKKTGELAPPFYVRRIGNGKPASRRLDAQTFNAAKDEAPKVDAPAIADADRIAIQGAV
jgi:hypothetical protein